MILIPFLAPFYSFMSNIKVTRDRYIGNSLVRGLWGLSRRANDLVGFYLLRNLKIDQSPLSSLHSSIHTLLLPLLHLHLPASPYLSTPSFPTYSIPIFLPPLIYPPPPSPPTPSPSSCLHSSSTQHIFSFFHFHNLHPFFSHFQNFHLLLSIILPYIILLLPPSHPSTAFMKPFK